jgi:hypothetical protein
MLSTFFVILPPRDGPFTRHTVTVTITGGHGSACPGEAMNQACIFHYHASSQGHTRVDTSDFTPPTLKKGYTVGVGPELQHR